MQTSTAGNVPLPYKLRRPYFTFFAVFTVACLLTLAGVALFGSREGLMLTLLLVGPLWVGLSLGVVFNWQSLTLHADHLLFKHFWKKHWILYKDPVGGSCREGRHQDGCDYVSLPSSYGDNSTFPSQGELQTLRGQRPHNLVEGHQRRRTRRTFQ